MKTTAKTTRPLILLQNEEDHTDVGLLALPPKGMTPEDALTLIYAAVAEVKERYPDDWTYENAADVLRVSGFKFPKVVVTV